MNVGEKIREIGKELRPLSCFIEIEFKNRSKLYKVVILAPRMLHKSAKIQTQKHIACNCIICVPVLHCILQPHTKLHVELTVSVVVSE